MGAAQCAAGLDAGDRAKVELAGFFSNRSTSEPRPLISSQGDLCIQLDDGAECEYQVMNEKSMKANNSLVIPLSSTGAARSLACASRAFPIRQEADSTAFR
jgi:hypothetical protein